MGFYLITKTGPSIPHCTVREALRIDLELNDAQWLRGLRKLNTGEDVQFSSNTSKNLKWDYQMELKFIVFFSPLYSLFSSDFKNIRCTKKEGIDCVNYEYDAEKVKRERK